jgi:dTDP-4-dehydrorhamnose 3,5-epimerase
MKFTPTKLSEVIVIEPDVYKDDRGFFLESYQEKKYQDGGIGAQFIQDNHSNSVKNTLRGLHAQIKQPQGKLIRVIEGEVFDVAVDIRPKSPTFKAWVGVTLSHKNFKQIYIPPGFAHGFYVLSDNAQFEYKCTAYYNPADELTILWSDPEINIDWPATEPILSDKDKSAPVLSEVMDKLPS